MPQPFFTIGHSRRSVGEVVALLQESRVERIVDVRSMTRSRANPQFNEADFAAHLSEHQIGYEHIAELGGLRARQRLAPPELNAFWRVRSFHNYADYALTEPFAAGLARLRRLGAGQRCAIMCAEVLWWRCHRRIIADWLLAAGEQVFHILGPADVDPAQLTPGAVVRPDRSVIYPAPPPPPPPAAATG